MNYKLILVICVAVASTLYSYDNHWTPDYEAQSADEKRNYLFKQGEDDHGKTGKFAGGFEAIPLVGPKTLGGQDFIQVGENESDENDWERRKYIHSVGMHAKVAIHWYKNDYTGVFSDEKSIAIIRCSSATAPNEENTGPGFGLKVFRDGVPSGNFVAMWNLFGQDNDYNFFSHNLSNHVSGLPFFKLGAKFLGLKALNAKFDAYDNNPGMVGLSDLAKYTNAGESVSPKAPFALVFKPNKALTKLCSNKKPIGENFGCFPEIAKGTRLFTVYSVDRPIQAGDVTKEDLKKIAIIRTESEFIGSEFFDLHVQFKHVFWHNEIKALGKEEWNDITDSTDYRRADGAEKWDKVLKDQIFDTDAEDDKYRR